MYNDFSLLGVQVRIIAYIYKKLALTMELF